MKNLSTALMVIFTVLLSTQLISHAYMRISYSQESVLDKYSKKRAELPFDKTASLKELSLIYADAEKRVRLFEKSKSKKELSRYDSTDEPYYKKSKIEEIIASRENDNRMIQEIIVFWIIGLLLIAGGSFVYLKYDTYLGISLVTTGLIEMTLKLGPLFFITGVKPESVMLLNIKLIFSAITLAALIIYWHFGKSYIDR